jgi:hypothetical protein
MPKYKIVMHYYVVAKDREEAAERYAKYQTDVVYNQVQRWHLEMEKEAEVQHIYESVEEVKYA